MGIKISQIDDEKDPSVVADEEIAEFEKWMVTELKTDPLLRVEHAILKTFLVWSLSKKSGD